MLAKIRTLKAVQVRAQKKSEESCRESLYYLIEFIYHHEQNVTRNVSVKGASGKVSDGI